MKSQKEVDFEHPARGRHRCEECEYWVWDNQCRIVEGNVYPDDWCKLWTLNRLAPIQAKP